MKKILVVDDDEFDIMAFERFFKRNSDIKLETAKSIEEAKEKLAVNKYDVIICDYKLKDGNALELMDIKSEIPLIIITGTESIELETEALKMGVYDFIVKDTKGEYLKVLPTVIRNAMGRNRVEAEMKKYHKELLKTIEEKTIELENEKSKCKKNKRELVKANNEIRKAKNAMIFALATLAEFRDSETGAHTLRIREYCKVLAVRLKGVKQFKGQITKQFIENIYNTSVLHDIGKVGIPDAILLKKGKLSKEEFEIMKKHAEIGGKALARVYESHPNHNFLEMATDIVLHHHEKWNGEGYPRGLCANEISLAARITTYADIFDALMSERTYKKAYSKEKTLEIMKSEKGVTLDPYIFPYFEEIFEEFVEIFKAFQDENFEII